MRNILHAKHFRETRKMADRPRFGPAGVPHIFRVMGAKLPDVPTLLRQEELDAFEYQAVRWGQKPQVKQEDAQSLGREARRNDVQLSLHGSYFINLAGADGVVEASKRRLIACATAAAWMKAYVVVFHPGYYGKMGKIYSFKRCTEALKDVVKSMESLGIREVKLGPETMGKHSQLGSLEEVLTLCEEVEHIHLVIDWGHLHARGAGKIAKTADFRAIVEDVERRLGTEFTRNMHCHFSKIEFTNRGERRHHVLDETKYGPNFEGLAEVIADFKLRPVIICETPLLDVDARKMRRILQQTIIDKSLTGNLE
jgi:deoxyribonuclease IV